MKILTFDTSLDKTYVTLSDDGVILSDEIIENHNEKYHSAFLMPTIVSILKKNNLFMQDIDAIATNIGPGSFTGIRTCVTVARVFAQQLNVPLVGVSSLEILSKIDTTNSRTIVVLDARKKQFYTAIYENGVEILAPALTDADDVLNFDFAGAVVVCDEVSAKFLTNVAQNIKIYTDVNCDLGIYLNKIASERLVSEQVDIFHWAKLKPLYLQVPPVSMPSKVK